MGERQAKEEYVGNLTQEIQRSKGIYLAAGTGIDANAMNDLRKKCREIGVRYLIAKNTLARRAFKDAGVEDVQEQLNGPTALILSFEDPIAPAKVLNDFAKGNEEKFRVKCGYLEGTYYDETQVPRLADIPSREVLLSMLASVLNAPMRNVASALSGILRNVPAVIDAVARKKGEESS